MHGTAAHARRRGRPQHGAAWSGRAAWPQAARQTGRQAVRRIPQHPPHAPWPPRCFGPAGRSARGQSRCWLRQVHGRAGRMHGVSRAGMPLAAQHRGLQPWGWAVHQPRTSSSRISRPTAGHPLDVRHIAYGSPAMSSRHAFLSWRWMRRAGNRWLSSLPFSAPESAGWRMLPCHMRRADPCRLMHCWCVQPASACCAGPPAAGEEMWNDSAALHAADGTTRAPSSRLLMAHACPKSLPD